MMYQAALLFAVVAPAQLGTLTFSTTATFTATAGTLTTTATLTTTGTVAEEELVELDLTECVECPSWHLDAHDPEMCEDDCFPPEEEEQPEPDICGNGFVEEGEECDLGDNDPQWGCDTDCFRVSEPCTGGPGTSAGCLPEPSPICPSAEVLEVEMDWASRLSCPLFLSGG